MAVNPHDKKINISVKTWIYNESLRANFMDMNDYIESLINDLKIEKEVNKTLISMLKGISSIEEFKEAMAKLGHTVENKPLDAGKVGL